jgi:hypothetical protein
MKKCILLTHIFIESSEDHKLDQSNFVVEHFRRNNPDAYIIVTGHGIKPDKLNEFCDYVDWRPAIIRKEIGYGHPMLVNAGIDHAIGKGFPYLLKTRLDGINLIPNIFDWCMEKLGDKKYLTTQATTLDSLVLCDLFNFGHVDFMKGCWRIDNWYPNHDGLVPHAKNFLDLCPEDKWIDALSKNCVLKDILTLKWIDFRAYNNWETLRGRREEMLLNNLPDYVNFLWGYPGFSWDSEGNLINVNSNRGTWATERSL